MDNGTRQHISNIDTWSEGDILKEKKKKCLVCGLNYTALNEFSQFHNLYSHVCQTSDFLLCVCIIFYVCTVQFAHLLQLF